ncbi:MAG: biosynthetic-type acetolactate synthase large subunit [Ruminococcus sp.]|nr:biosynthetic-type acetolactate synthase large subunit [Ruminococcus sp.]MCM1478841.1 biosynthetic-type acetolactate synthase large subunit [Muribaculaceae bacterium]
MILNGSQIILECLLEQGVDTVFGYPGGAVLNIYDALYDYSDRITHILTSHEQGASHAADGYSRTTGKTGVVIATSGPGATNLVTGLATAYMDSIPMVAITGNVATSLLGLDSFQEVDITGITMPITKHNYIVKDVTKLADAIREAFFIANDGRKGPVLIDIPKDITAAKCEYEPQKPREHTYSVNDEEIAQAAEIIAKAEKPFIYAGGGVVSCDACRELAQLAETVDAPVSLSLMGQCAFDNTNPRYTGMMGMHGTKTSSLALTECDLLIVLGSRFSDRVTCNTSSFRTAAGRAKILHIDIDPAEVNKNITADYKVCGNLKIVLEKLNGLLKPVKHTDWLNQIAQWKKTYPLCQVTEDGDKDDVLPQEVLETLHEITNGEAIISTEVGQHQMWAAEFYDFRNPRSFASSGGLGTMGYGLGAAIGCKVGNPDKVVVNCAGDGSFYMNMNELTTLAKYRLPVIELVFNNSVLGMVRQWQKLFYNNHFSQTTLEKPTDFELLGKALGITAMTIRTKSDIRPVLEKAVALNEPVLINCVIDKDINVLPMVPAGASIAEPILKI